MNTFVKLSIVISALTAVILIRFPDISKYNLVLINHLLNRFLPNEQTVDPKTSCLSAGEQLFTKSQLSRYDGSGDSLGLYLAFLGVVYDVSKGAQHYKPGQSYGFFAGKDGTRAYITGDFTASGLTDDLSGLEVELFDGIQTWIDLYEKDYKRVGKLIATYYDSNGCETEALEWVRHQMQRNNALNEEMNEESKVFPFCNSEWDGQTNSGRVWCSRQSGGIDRNWVGVPRQLYTTANKQHRCACVRDTGPPTVPVIIYADEDQTSYESENSQQNVGDLYNPRLKQYEGCDPKAFECRIKD